MKTYNKILASVLVGLMSAQSRAGDNAQPAATQQQQLQALLMAATPNPASSGHSAQPAEARRIPGLAEALAQPATDAERKGAAAVEQTDAERCSDLLHNNPAALKQEARQTRFENAVAAEKASKEELQRIRREQAIFEANQAQTTQALMRAAAAGRLRAWNNNPDNGRTPDKASDKEKQYQSFRHMVDAAIAAQLQEQASKGISSSELETNLRKARNAYIQQRALDKMGPGFIERVLTKGLELGATQAVAELSHQGATFALDKAVIPFKKLYEKATSTEEEFKLRQELVEEKRRAEMADLRLELLAKKVTSLDKEAKAELLAEALKEAEAAMEEAFAARKEDNQKPDEADGLQPLAESDNKL